MKSRALGVQRAISLLGTLLLMGLWVCPTLSTPEKTAAHLWGVVTSLGTSLGALVLLCIACLCRAQWACATAPLLLACALSMRSLALLTLPLLWVLPNLIPSAALPATQQAWFAPLPFALRGVCYLLLWSVAAEIWRVRSAQSNAFDAAPMRRLSASLLPSLVITLTLASIDWLMALSAPWQTTAVGVYVFAGALSAATGAVLLGAWLVRDTSWRIAPAHIHVLGRLLFVFNFFWAYIAVGQLLIIVMADLPDEITWYAVRSTGLPAVASLALALGHFAVPFGLLLFDRFKRDLNALATLSAWGLAMHALDMHTLIVPSLADDIRPGFGLLAGLLGVTSLTGAAMVTRFRQLPQAQGAP